MADRHISSLTGYAMACQAGQALNVMSGSWASDQRHLQYLIWSVIHWSDGLTGYIRPYDSQIFLTPYTACTSTTWTSSFLGGSLILQLPLLLMLHNVLVIAVGPIFVFVWSGPPWAYLLVGMAEGPPNHPGWAYLPAPHPYLPSHMPIVIWMDGWLEGHGSTQTKSTWPGSYQAKSSGSSYQLSSTRVRAHYLD